MPKPRSYGAIESPTHGNVLWAALCHGGTRIGFAFTAERQTAYPEFNEAAAVAEATASVKPFNFEIQTSRLVYHIFSGSTSRPKILRQRLRISRRRCMPHT